MNVENDLIFKYSLILLQLSKSKDLTKIININTLIIMFSSSVRKKYLEIYKLEGIVERVSLLDMHLP